MTRQMRRRVVVACASSVAGISSPLWGPPLLRAMPAFQVEEVRVEQARYVDPDQAKELAAIPPGASVWDDPGPWLERLLSHPLVLDAHVRRIGLHRISLVLEEVEPVALVAAPELTPVGADGGLLPIDPAGHHLDLPILLRARLRENRVDDEPSRQALSVLGELRELAPSFVSRVSALRAVPLDAVEFSLTNGSIAKTVRLPAREAAVAFLRVEAALRECDDRGRVRSVDARFRNEVIVAMRERS